jgi:hypothetical protein
MLTRRIGAGAEPEFVCPPQSLGVAPEQQLRYPLGGILLHETRAPTQNPLVCLDRARRPHAIFRLIETIYLGQNERGRYSDYYDDECWVCMALGPSPNGP